jgi:hypothetical protein
MNPEPLRGGTSIDTTPLHHATYPTADCGCRSPGAASSIGPTAFADACSRAASARETATVVGDRYDLCGAWGTNRIGAADGAEGVHGDWTRDAVRFMAVRHLGDRLAEVYRQFPGLKYPAAAASAVKRVGLGNDNHSSPRVASRADVTGLSRCQID